MKTNQRVLVTLGVILALLLGGAALAQNQRDDTNGMFSSPRPTASSSADIYSNTSPSPSPMLFESPSPFPSASPGMDSEQSSSIFDSNTNRVILNMVSGSQFKQTGLATLSERDGKVYVSLRMTEASGLSSPQPAHIHLGSCPNPGNVIFPLTTVVNGNSETVLNTTLNDMKTQGKLAINVHKSADELETSTACGNLSL